MQRTIFGIQVVRLTLELAERLAQQARVAYVGNGRCTLRNMETSCFASEMCSKKLPCTHSLPDMCHKETYIAISDCEPDGTALPVADVPRYVGCVSVEPMPGHMRGDFPQVTCRDWLLANLCVAGAYRRLGVGSRLIAAVQRGRAPDGGGGALYLFVHRTRSLDDDVRRVFETRTPRLVAHYKTLGFVVCGTSDAHHLMRASTAIVCDAPPDVLR
jgi:ribosomal protein S18 acetylase RimI-like enzyme